MRFFIVALLLCGSSMAAIGQVFANMGSSEIAPGNLSPIVINDVQRVAYKTAYPPGYRMRNSGRVMTIIGAPLFIGGLIVFANADEMYYNSVTTSSGTYTEGDPQAAVGTLMIVAGAGLTIPGIILWSKGAKKYKRHLEQEAAFNFTGTSLSLSYRF
ncbi:MAG TPA: hypothetical protein VIU13_02110 [Chryseolinea sp.]